MLVMPGQPSAFEPQVITVEPPVHTLPWTPMQAAGAASHEQDAMGRVPVHGLPAGQAVDGPLYTQPSASATQFSRVMAVEQYVPARPPQPAGAVAQSHFAAGAWPM